MKLIDKYILRSFLVPTAYCLLTFCMLFIVFDLFDHLSDFIDARTSFPQIVRYYLYILPAMLVFIVPRQPVASATLAAGAGNVFVNAY